MTLDSRAHTGSNQVRLSPSHADCVPPRSPPPPSTWHPCEQERDHDVQHDPVSKKDEGRHPDHAAVMQGGVEGGRTAQSHSRRGGLTPLDTTMLKT